MCPLGLAKSQKFNGKAAFSVKSHSNVQALLLMPYTLCARVCARAYCAVSEMEMIDTTSTSVICIVYTSSITWAHVHRSSAELCQGGLSQHVCFCWDAGQRTIRGDQVGHINDTTAVKIRWCSPVMSCKSWIETKLTELSRLHQKWGQKCAF